MKIWIKRASALNTGSRTCAFPSKEQFAGAVPRHWSDCAKDLTDTASNGWNLFSQKVSIFLSKVKNPTTSLSGYIFGSVAFCWQLLFMWMLILNMILLLKPMPQLVQQRQCLLTISHQRTMSQLLKKQQEILHYPCSCVALSSNTVTLHFYTLLYCNDFQAAPWILLQILPES